jgi:hypothetical protein
MGWPGFPVRIREGIPPVDSGQAEGSAAPCSGRGKKLIQTEHPRGQHDAEWRHQKRGIPAGKKIGIGHREAFITSTFGMRDFSGRDRIIDTGWESLKPEGNLNLPISSLTGDHHDPDGDQ